MRSQIGRLLGTIGAILCMCPHVLGQSQANFTRKQLQEEFVPRLHELRQSYEKLKGKGVLRVSTDIDLTKQKLKQLGKDTSRITQHGRQLIEAYQISFAVAGQYRQCDVKRDDTAQLAVPSQQDPSKLPRRTVSNIGPRGSFALKWRIQEDTPEIKSFSMKNVDPSSQYQSSIGAFLQAAYAMPCGDLADRLQDDNFRIDRIETVTIDGHPCPRVSFEWVMTPKATAEKPKRKPYRAVGSFVADPALGYALRSWEYGSSATPDRTQAVSIEYFPQASPEEPPLPREIKHLIDKVLQRTLTIEQITRTTVPDSQFTLSTYGLPEMDRPVGDLASNAIPIGLGMAALALLGLAAWFRRRSRTLGAQP